MQEAGQDVTDMHLGGITGDQSLEEVNRLLAGFVGARTLTLIEKDLRLHHEGLGPQLRRPWITLGLLDHDPRQA